MCVCVREREISHDVNTYFVCSNGYIGMTKTGEHHLKGSSVHLLTGVVAGDV